MRIHDAKTAYTANAGKCRSVVAVLMAARNSAERTYALRMILLGEAGAGKTCLFHWIKYKVPISTRRTSCDVKYEIAPLHHGTCEESIRTRARDRLGHYLH